jgi:hypothetical protein
MEKEFVPYELALKMKQLGFDEPCFGYYDHTIKKLDTISSDVCERLCKHDTHIKAPTYSQSFRWFRENHDLVHEISWSKYKGGLNFDYDVFSLVLPTDDELGDVDDIVSDKSMETYDSLVDKDFRHKESDSYEESELTCLEKLIEIVEQKNKKGETN